MDASGNGLAEAAGKLVEELNKADELSQSSRKTPGGGEAFAQALEQTSTNPEIGNVSNQNRDATSVLRSAQTQLNNLDGTNAIPSSTRIGSAEKAKESRLANMLEGLMRGQDKMQEIMEMALSGRQFAPQELLGMQAGVYRFTQELELTSKVVEKATSGVKQTINTQV